MNLFVAISDVHLSLKTLDVAIATLKQSLIRSRDLKVPLFIAGDLNDGKAIMRSEWVKALIDLFFEFSDVQIHVMVGNHDLDNKNSEGHSLYFLKTLPNVKIYDQPTTIKMGEDLWGIIPYMPSKEEFKKQISFMQTNDIKRLLIHQGILGAHMGDYVVDESSVSPEEFSGFEIVLSGHYHRAQKVGENIHYFGSPFTVNFGEANEEKFIWVVEQIQNKIYLKPELTGARRHFQFECTKDTIAQATRLNWPPAGSLIKVVVKGTKEFVKSTTLEYFKTIYPGAASISIVPEIDKQSENRISADIIHSPLKVVDAYLEQCTTDHNKIELKKFLLQSCAEIFEKFTSITGKSFKILSVDAENILSFKKLHYDYSPMGLTLLEGYDADLGVNTGTGKSTFLDIPVYGIFGETSKKLKADEVINRLVNRDLSTITTLQGDDGIYKIYRYRKHHEKENDLYMLLPSGQELRGKDNRETQKLIEQTIGCTFDVFLKSTYFTQFGNIDRFLSATDSEKKKLISEITDLSIYDELLDSVKKSVSADEKEIDQLKIKIDQFKSNIQLLNDQLDNLKENASRWNTNHQIELDTFKTLIDKFELDKAAEINMLTSKRDFFEQEKSQELIALQSKKQEWVQIQSFKVREIEDQSKAWEDNQSKIKSENNNKININEGHIAGIEFQIQELQAFPIVDISAEKKKISDKLDIVRKLEDQIIQLDSNKFHKLKEKDAIERKIQAEQDKIASSASSDCLFCHQKVSAEHIQKHIDAYQEELKPILVDLEAAKNKIDQVRKAVESKHTLQSNLKDLEAKDKQQFEIKYKIELHQRSIQQYKDQNVSIAKENEVQHINPFNGQIEGMKNAINPFDSQIDIAQAKENPFNVYISNAQAKENTQIASYEKHKLLINPHIEGQQQLEVKIQGVHEQLADTSNAIDQIGIGLKYGIWWKQAIHIYIKSYLMDSCLESINSIANEYLQTLFDGVLKFDISATTEKGSEVKEKINVSIINNGDECSYDSLSGGERCRICLAVNLALAEVISKSSGKSFNMIFLDEILNGLDESGKSQSMKLLKDLETKYETIFVIDHAEGFKNLFSNSIMITKKDKVSTVV